MVSRPTISGSSRSPDTVGLTPLTICMYWGRYAIVPNKANPTTKPIALAAENTRLRNSFSGMTGSSARLSAQMNAAPRITAPPPRMKIGADDQG